MMGKLAANVDGRWTSQKVAQRFSVKPKYYLPGVSHEETSMVIKRTHGARDDLQGW